MTAEYKIDDDVLRVLRDALQVEVRCVWGEITVSLTLNGHVISSDKVSLTP